MSTREHAPCLGCGGCLTCGVHTKGVTCNETSSTPGQPDDLSDVITIPRYHLDQLLAAATTYIEAFEPEEMMTLPQKLALQEIETVVEHYGRRY